MNGNSELEKVKLNFLETLYQQYTKGEKRKSVSENAICLELEISNDKELVKYAAYLEEKGWIKRIKIEHHFDIIINEKGIEELMRLRDIIVKEKLVNTDTKTNIVSSSVKIDLDYLITKFEKCIKEIQTLQNPPVDLRMLDQIFESDNFSLIGISKRIQNLLKIGFNDGKERSDNYSIEGNKFYHGLQSQIRPHISGMSLKESKFQQHLRWHKMKANEFLDELKLIRESNLNTRRTFVSEKGSNPDPKAVLKHYSKQLEDLVKNREYHGVMAIIDGLYFFLKRISLQKGERYHLQNSMDHLSSMAHSLWVGESISNENPEKKENDFKEYIQPPYQNVMSILKSIIENPIELKYLERPIKEKKTFLSNFKNFLHDKKYLDVSNVKDPFYQKLIVEINKAYNNAMPLSILLLLRKLFETMIADLLWKKYQDSSLFREENGKSKGLLKIIKNAEEKSKNGNFTNDDRKFLEVLEFIKSLRDYGNKSAHDITFDVTPDEIEQMKKNTNQATNFLFRTMNLL